MATWSCTTLLQAKRVGGHIQEENAKRSWQISRGDDKDILIIDVERETREREHYWQGPVFIAFSCVSGDNIHMFMYMTTLKRWHFLCMVHSNICHSFQTRTISDYLYFWNHFHNKTQKWYNVFICQIHLFDAGVGKYRFEAQCSFRYSPPFSSYSARVTLLVVNKGDNENFLAPYQASRIGFSGEKTWKKYTILWALKMKNEISVTKTSLFLLSWKTLVARDF